MIGDEVTARVGRVALPWPVGVREVLDQLRLLTSSDLKVRYIGDDRAAQLDGAQGVGNSHRHQLERDDRARDAQPRRIRLAIEDEPDHQQVHAGERERVDQPLDGLPAAAAMGFRKALLPISTALTEGAGFVASLTLLALMMAIYGVAPTASIAWIPLVLAVTLVFGIAVAYPVTLIGIWAPDMRGLLLSVVRTAYYLAPGLVTLAAIHGRTNNLVRLNPLTGLFEALRHAVLYRTAPPAWELVYPLVAALLILVVFVPMYAREQKHFAKVLE
jgi:hypothetical protein